MATISPTKWWEGVWRGFKIVAGGQLSQKEWKLVHPSKTFIKWYVWMM